MAKRVRKAGYVVWCGMKARCNNPNEPAYKNYGARGIRVCARWIHSFDNFVADMGLPPKGLTLERVNNDGDYLPENCVWADRKTQNRNSRNNAFRPKDVEFIRRQDTTKYGSKRALARKFRVSEQAINGVVFGHTWA